MEHMCILKTDRDHMSHRRITELNNCLTIELDNTKQHLETKTNPFI